MSKYEKKRDKILDKIIELRNQYFDLCQTNTIFISKSFDEDMKYARTQDDFPAIPRHHLQDLASDIDINQKIQTLVHLINLQYTLTEQEREFLNTLFD